MQFHQNGFHAGDPDIHKPAPGFEKVATDRLPETIDVLIVGCGSAGLTLAAQLCAFPDITTRIVDIFNMRGIDRELGCILIVRPDQHVAHVLPLDGYKELAAFFNGFMIEPSR